MGSALPGEAGFVDALIRASWGTATGVSRGALQDTSDLSTLVARRQGLPVGALTYAIADGALQVMTLDATEAKRGIGTALLSAAFALAQRSGCSTVWLTTSNDNLPAISLHRKMGMRLRERRRGAMAEARQLKPTIPLTGWAGEPITDELEFAIEVEPLPPEQAGRRAGR